MLCNLKIIYQYLLEKSLILALSRNALVKFSIENYYQHNSKIGSKHRLHYPMNHTESETRKKLYF